MEPTNPFAPPSAPLDRPTRSRWAALWWLPSGVLGGISFICLLVTVVAIGNSFQAVTRLGTGHPLTVQLVGSALICAGLCLGCGGIAYAWYRRRWVRALILMALCYGIGVAIATQFDGR